MTDLSFSTLACSVSKLWRLSAACASKFEFKFRREGPNPLLRAHADVRGLRLVVVDASGDELVDVLMITFL